MGVRVSTLELAGARPEPDGDPAAWTASALEGWRLPGRLAGAWLLAVQGGLHDDARAELRLEYDDALGLVSLEVRAADGRVLVGIDDLVGAPGG